MLVIIQTQSGEENYFTVTHGKLGNKVYLAYHERVLYIQYKGLWYYREALAFKYRAAGRYTREITIDVSNLGV